jgi:uncharacterized protein (TIGR00730 family)
MANSDIKLIYGAGNIGLMGVIADTVLDANGYVVGVIPDFLKAKEVCHTELQELLVTTTMHQRKEIMANRADAFIAMPGGFGTLDELAEILTWAQLGLHSKPIGILNVNGYFDSLIKFFDDSVAAGYVTKMNRAMVLADDTVEGLIEKMEAYEAPDVTKWLNRGRI